MKKLQWFLLAIVLMAALAACGSHEGVLSSDKSQKDSDDSDHVERYDTPPTDDDGK